MAIILFSYFCGDKMDYRNSYLIAKLALIIVIRELAKALLIITIVWLFSKTITSIYLIFYDIGNLFILCVIIASVYNALDAHNKFVP